MRTSPVVRLARAVGLALGVALAAGGPAAAAQLTVTTTADVVNGDVTNPATLQATPGPDGISLREAVAAVHGAPGPHVIRFGAALVGRTIRLTAGLVVRQRGVSIVGRDDASGAPAITIDALAVSGAILAVRHSDFLLARLRIARVGPGAFGVFVRAGVRFGDPGPRRITNVQIRDNVFTVPTTMPATGHAISVGMDDATQGARVDDVTVRDNVFRGFRGADAVGIHVQAGGTANTIERVVIYRNVFTDVTFGVELVPFATQDSRIRLTRIVGNTFVGNRQPVNLNHIGTYVAPPTSRNVIADTEIAGNTFRANRGPDVVLLGGMDNASNNLTTRTRIANNVMTGSTQYGGVSLVGGRQGGTSNRIDGVFIVNNTIAGNVGGGVDINANLDGTVGNTVTGVVVRSSLFWNNTQDLVFWNVASPQVDHSLTTDGRFVGVNGNVSGDPAFVDAAAGDLRVGPGSPAIDAASSTGAPPRDIACRSRADDPDTTNTGAGRPTYTDIGAYEYRGGRRDCVAKVTVVVTGAGTVKSIPAGVACRGTCTVPVPVGGRLVLRARPDSANAFAGWGGECSRRGDCALTIVGDVRVVAEFLAIPAAAD
ncbi:MAG: hypothetical protein HYR51_08940 [Candidatus Rokubacteria bacterium]|nr:hypothetical protein [Candidatus Rokubacteria bacterium]